MGAWAGAKTRVLGFSVIHRSPCRVKVFPPHLSMAWNPSGDIDHAGHVDPAHGPGLSGVSDDDIMVTRPHRNLRGINEGKTGRKHRNA